MTEEVKLMYPTNLVHLGPDYFGLYRADGWKNRFGTPLVMTGTFEEVVEARTIVQHRGFYEGVGSAQVVSRDPKLRAAV